MLFRLCSGIEQEDVALVQRVNETVIVEHLPLHRGDGREGQPVTVTAGHLLNDGCHLRLVDARAHHSVGGQVHLSAQVHRCLDGADFLFVLVVALRRDGLDEWY